MIEHMCIDFILSVVMGENTGCFHLYSPAMAITIQHISSTIYVMMTALNMNHSVTPGAYFY